MHNLAVKGLKVKRILTTDAHFAFKIVLFTAVFTFCSCYAITSSFTVTIDQSFSIEDGLQDCVDGTVSGIKLYMRTHVASQTCRKTRRNYKYKTVASSPKCSNSTKRREIQTNIYIPFSIV